MKMSEWIEKNGDKEIIAGMNMIAIVDNDSEIKRGDFYYTLGDSGNSTLCTWTDTGFDKRRKVLGNCFKTMDEVDKARNELKLVQQLKDLGGRKASPNRSNWGILYNTSKDQLEIDSYATYISMRGIYFDTYDLAKRAVMVIGEDNLKELFRGE